MKKKIVLIATFLICFISIFAFSGCSNKLSVEFDTNGGSIIETVKLEKGDKIEKPEDPTKDGYIFDGWYISNEYIDENKWNFIGYSVSESMTLYAKWTPLSNISVSFNLCGGKGTATQKTNLTFDTSYGELPTNITKTGYKFAGWFTEENGNGEEITASSQIRISTAHTLYANWNEVFESGNGTESNPYIIKTRTQLEDFGNEIRHGETYSDIYIELHSDIDFNNEEWLPAGSGENGFCGYFNGKGNEIRNYKITKDTTYVGFFGSTNGGRIENLSLKNFTINVNATRTIIYAGGLVGANSVYTSLGKTIIQNCSVVGNIYVAGAEATAGSISGTNGGTISNCFSSVDVTAYSKSTNSSCYAGGLVGKNSGTVSNCVTLGNVTAKKDYLYEYVSNSYAGTLFGSDSTYSDQQSNHYFEEQQVTRVVGSTNYTPAIKGTSCSKQDLNSSEFYIVTLSWNSLIWNFETLNIENLNFPTLN